MINIKIKFSFKKGITDWSSLSISRWQENVHANLLLWKLILAMSILQIEFDRN